MGSGEVGGGGSVNFRLEFDDPGMPAVAGKDQKNKPKDDVGKSKGHNGFFKIRLKFESEGDRDEAYNSVAKLGDKMIVMFAKASDDENNADMIRIDW